MTLLSSSFLVIYLNIFLGRNGVVPNYKLHLVLRADCKIEILIAKQEVPSADQIDVAVTI